MHAIANTAPRATQLCVPNQRTTYQDQDNINEAIQRSSYQYGNSNIQTSTRNDNAPVIVNGVEIPSLCADINRKDALDKALEYLTRTKVEEEPLVEQQSTNPIQHLTEKHRACICVMSLLADKVLFLKLKTVKTVCTSHKSKSTLCA